VNALPGYVVMDAIFMQIFNGVIGKKKKNTVVIKRLKDFQYTFQNG